MKKILIFLILFLNLSLLNCTIINTFYGKIYINENSQEKIILNLISTPEFQRLKKLHQYGVSHYVKKHILYVGDPNNQDYTRYDHSLGVFAILKIFNRPLTEQISGLLHDISHTAFSHVADHLFKYNGTGIAFQDKIFENFINKSINITRILHEYNINIKDILPDNGLQIALEKELPDICADRLEYTLQGGYKAGILTFKDIRNILSNLNFENNQWYFSTSLWAQRLTQASLYLTEFNTGAAWNAIIYEQTAKALEWAILTKELNLEKFKKIYTDDEVWKKLKKSSRPIIKMYIFFICNHEDLFFIEDKLNNETKLIVTKFRVIDPLVNDQGVLKRLSFVNEVFNLKYNSLKNRFKEGWAVKFASPICNLRGC